MPKGHFPKREKKKSKKKTTKQPTLAPPVFTLPDVEVIRRKKKPREKEEE